MFSARRSWFMELVDSSMVLRGPRYRVVQPLYKCPEILFLHPVSFVIFKARGAGLLVSDFHMQSSSTVGLLV